MNLSRQTLYAAGEPFGDSATRREAGRRLICGGGGGSKSEKTPIELRQLYTEQAASARMLRNQAEAHLPGAVTSYVGKVNDFTNPARVERQAAMAGADMASANAMERDATTRELASMGVNPNDARFVGSMRTLETENAARMAAGKNLARNEADKFGLAVAQDAVGTFTGQSNSAATQMSGASSGLQSLFSQESASKRAASANQANAVGNAVGGTMAVGSLAGWWADGGKVTDDKLIRVGGVKQLERHMLGGQAGKAQQATQQGFFRMQAPPAPQTFDQPQQQPQADPVGQGIKTAKNVKRMGEPVARTAQSRMAGADMAPDQARAAADAYDAAAANAKGTEAAKYRSVADQLRGGAGITEAAPEGFQAANAATAQQSGAAVLTPAAETATGTAAGTAAGTGTGAGGFAAANTAAANASGASLLGTTGAATGTAAAGSAGTGALGTGLAATGADAIATGALTGSLTTGAGATAAGAGAAGTTALASGAGAAAGGAMAALGAAMPWLGAAYAVGSLLGAWADGGEVSDPNRTVDLRDGDKVPGEWKENRDTVPALLVEEEHVLNAEASALVGHDELERLNKQGLKLRAKGLTPDAIGRGFGITKLKRSA